MTIRSAHLHLNDLDGLSLKVEHAYNSLVKEAGRVFPQVKLTHVKKLPLVIPDKSKQKEVAELVKQILAAKRRDAGADTTGCEREIDRLVYELYGLTKDEIAIVDRQILLI